MLHGADHHEARRPVLRRHAGRPAGLERRRAAAHRRQRAPSSSRTASSSASPTTSCRRRPRGSWLSPCVVLYAAMLFWQRARRAQARARQRPDRVAGRCASPGSRSASWRSSSTSCNQDRGIPYVLLVLAGLFIFWTYVLNRTRFGRHVYAVGGNAEAARRAGINVDHIQIACFAICSMMAAVGGIILASRLRSVDTNSGGGSLLLYSIAARRHRRHLAVRRPRHREVRRPRRARHRVDRQRPRPARARLGRRSSSSPAACCCSRCRSTPSRAADASRPVERDGRRAPAPRSLRGPVRPHPVTTKGGSLGEQGELCLMALRWGILSTANITDKLLDSGTDQEFVAVGSRDGARAEAYAREKGIARAHGSYEALLADPEVDAIYNPLPNALHVEWSIRALRGGQARPVREAAQPPSRGRRRAPSTSPSARAACWPRRSCGATTRRSRAPRELARRRRDRRPADHSRALRLHGGATPTTSACRPSSTAAA